MGILTFHNKMVLYYVEKGCIMLNTENKLIWSDFNEI